MQIVQFVGVTNYTWTVHLHTRLQRDLSPRWVGARNTPHLHLPSGLETVQPLLPLEPRNILLRFKIIFNIIYNKQCAFQKLKWLLAWICQKFDLLYSYIIISVLGSRKSVSAVQWIGSPRMERLCRPPNPRSACKRREKSYFTASV